jgi:prepilin-type processing-associated H-X9-DG protein
MNGFPDRPGSFRLVDYPSFYHNLGGAFAFGDGHAEHHRWRDARTTPRFTGSIIPLNQPQPNNPDVAWLCARATVPK